MNLIYEHDVALLKKINKVSKSDALNLYIQIRVGICRNKMWTTSITTTSIISILLSFYFFSVSFTTHDTVTLVLRMITLLFLLICNVFFMKMHLREKQKIQDAVEAFKDGNNQKEMIHILNRYTDIDFGM